MGSDCVGSSSLLVFLLCSFNTIFLFSRASPTTSPVKMEFSEMFHSRITVQCLETYFLLV